VQVRLAAHQAADQVVELEPHRSGEAKFKLAPMPAAAPKKPPPVPAPLAKAPEVTPLTWIVLGGGTLGLTSALFVEMANRESEGITRTGAFLAGIGITATAVGGVLLYVDLNPGKRGDKAQNLSLELHADGRAALRYSF
jgi:hypothetical protein